MDVSRPYSAVTSSVEASVLIALARIEEPITGRRVAAIVDRGSQSAVNTALGKLADQGIVRRQESASAYLYEINRDHLAFGAVSALASMRSELISRLKERLREWGESGVGPRFACMFGSAARGDGDIDSDVDIFLLRPSAVADDDDAWVHATEDLRLYIENLTGNSANLIEVSEIDLCSVLEKPLGKEIIRDQVLLFGSQRLTPTSP
ncbi:MAG: nucleotidyltransferase domain-containing protein [Actinomycetes bacterium]|jgi:predicted nucleotidyltransferase